MSRRPVTKITGNPAEDPLSAMDGDGSLLDFDV
jgi:hypothetical protein